MKKLKLLVLSAFIGVLTVACSSPEPEPVKQKSNPVNNLINKGMNEVMKEATEQLSDTGSVLNQALDTISDVFEQNKEEINQGLKMIQKVF